MWTVYEIYKKLIFLANELHMKMPREMILEKKAQTKEHGYSLSLIRKSSFRQEYCLTSQCEKLQNTFMSSTIQRRRFEKAAGRAEDFLNDNLVYGRWLYAYIYLNFNWRKQFTSKRKMLSIHWTKLLVGHNMFLSKLNLEVSEWISPCLIEIRYP